MADTDSSSLVDSEDERALDEEDIDELISRSRKSPPNKRWRRSQVQDLAELEQEVLREAEEIQRADPADLFRTCCPQHHGSFQQPLWEQHEADFAAEQQQAESAAEQQQAGFEAEQQGAPESEQCADLPGQRDDWEEDEWGHEQQNSSWEGVVPDSEDEADLEAEARGVQREANAIPRPPPLHAAAAEFARFGATYVGLQAVHLEGSAERICCFDGCHSTAVVECLSCQAGPTLLCAEHDLLQHPWAHQHRRSSLCSAFRQPLRPTQQYSAGHAATSWPDRMLIYDVPPLEACSCSTPTGSKHWVLDQQTTENQQRPLILVTSSGRCDFHRACYRCSSCSRQQWQHWPEFMQLGFLPASLHSLNCTYVSEVELMHLRAIHRHTNTSWRSRALVIDRLGSDLYNQVAHVNPKTLTGGYRIFRQLQYHVEHCQGQDRSECPACAHGMHSGHADGNMKLWVTAGRQVHYTSHYEGQEGAIFIDDSHAREYVKTVSTAGGSTSQSHDKVCGRSTFTAAGDRASSAQGKLLTGRFVLGCSHLMISKMVNMFVEFGSERYAYPMMMAAVLKQRGAKVFFGDLVCKWLPYMQRTFDQLINMLGEGQVSASIPRYMLLERSQLDTMTFGTSAVHSYAHVWYCQVLFGPLYQQGAALENGEFTELINSFLSAHSTAVRNMSIGSSTDYLTELAWDWNWDKTLALTQYIKHRFTQAKAKLAVAKEEWKKIQRQARDVHGLTLNRDVIASIGSDVRAAAQGQWQRSQRRLTPASQYIKLILLIKETRALVDLMKTFDETEVALSSTMLADIKGMAVKLHDELPKHEAALEACKQQLVDTAGTDQAAEQQQQQPGVRASVTSTAQAVLLEIQELIQQLAEVGSDDVELRDRLLGLAAQLAATHTKMHHLAATADGPSGQAEWEQQLVSHILDNLEDEMEAHYLLLYKWNAKLRAGNTTTKEKTLLRDRIKGLKATLARSVNKYNTLRTKGTEDRDAVADEQVTSGNFPWSYRDANRDAQIGVPFKEKLRIWAAHNQTLRAQEQLQKLQQDARSFAQYYEQVLQRLNVQEDIHSSWLKEHASSSAVQAGLVALAAKGRHFAQAQQQLGQELMQQLQAT